MPVLKKEIELDNGKKIWVRQASGMDKLAIEKYKPEFCESADTLAQTLPNGRKNNNKSLQICLTQKAQV